MRRYYNRTYNRRRHNSNTRKLDIKIKYKDENVPRLKKIQNGDWIDLYAQERVIIPKGEMKLINLGIAMELPKGYEAYVLPRSSTFKKWGIIMVNSQGVIDESYCGDNDYWHFPAYCLEAKADGYFAKDSDSRFVKFMVSHEFTRKILKKFFKKTADAHTCSIIEPGDKIAQFRIIKHMEPIKFKVVDKLDNKNRGGFGSTGSK